MICFLMVPNLTRHACIHDFMYFMILSTHRFIIKMVVLESIHPRNGPLLLLVFNANVSVEFGTRRFDTIVASHWRIDVYESRDDSSNDPNKSS
jgi:hypothetical protein